MIKFRTYLRTLSLAILGLTTYSWAAMVPQRDMVRIQATHAQLKSTAGGAIPRHDMIPKDIPGGMVPRGNMRVPTRKELANTLLDLCCAYGLLMTTTLVHELGHGLTANLLHGSAFGIVIGAHPIDGQDIKPEEVLGWLKIEGLNPKMGYTVRIQPVNSNITSNAAILLAGPICGTLSSYLALKMISKCRRDLHITRFMLRYFLLTQTLGEDGLLGLCIPGSDSYKAAKLLCPKLLTYCPDVSRFFSAPQAFKS